MLFNIYPVYYNDRMDNVLFVPVVALVRCQRYAIRPSLSEAAVWVWAERSRLGGKNVL